MRLTVLCLLFACAAALKRPSFGVRRLAAGQRRGTSPANGVRLAPRAADTERARLWFGSGEPRKAGRLAKAFGVCGALLATGAKGAVAAGARAAAPAEASLAKTIFQYVLYGSAVLLLYVTWKERFKVRGSLESNEVQLALKVDWTKPNVVSALNDVAENADVSTDQGLAEVVGDAAQVLLDYRKDWVIGSCEKRRFIGASTAEGAEAAFDRRLARERLAWESSYRGTHKGEPIEEGVGAAKGLAEMPEGSSYAVIGIMMLWNGKNYQMPVPQKGDEDPRSNVQRIEESLTAMASRVPAGAEALRAAEVLWTPEEDTDTLGEDEVATKWPGLTRL